ncbi:MAG: hypothetical protein ACO1O6_06975 [Bacteroidota bacterium]
MAVLRDEVLKIRDEIERDVNLDQNFKRLSEILDVLKNEDNIYLVNVFKIIFQTSKDSIREDPTTRGYLPFQHFSETFLNSFRDEIV